MPVQPALPLPPSPTKCNGSKLPTPINVSVFAYLLEGYEDREYIINGFTEGFMVSFEGEEQSLDSPNSRAALLIPEAVDNKLQKEIDAGRVSGPSDDPPFQNFKCSPLSIREKSTPGEYRLLHNLSYPYDNNSVNGNIPDHHAKVKYASLVDAIKIIQKLGPNCYLAKSDIKGAFRIVPLHPSQYHLMGFKWRGKFYFDKCLAMGLRSSCKIFEAVSSGLLYILKKRFNIQDVVKVLDDFLFLALTFVGCKLYLDVFLEVARMINLPIAFDKMSKFP